MIVPSERLVRWVAAAGLPLSLIAALRPDWSSALVILAVLGGLAVLVDALRCRAALNEVSMEAPPLIRLIQGQTATIAIPWRAPPGRAPRTVALAWPAGAGAASHLAAAHRQPGIGAGTAEWTLRPPRRGRLHMTAGALSASSPWGLWESRRRVALATEIHVLPNLREERRRMTSRFLARGRTGLRLRRQVGKGREFEKLREYVAGDSYEDIHWKASARRRHPVTKVFQVERTQEIYVAIDASRLSARPAPAARADGGPPPTCLDRMVTAALLLLAAAREQGDRFGLIVFDRRIRRFLPAGHGAAHIDRCRQALFDVSAEPVSPDPFELFVFLRSRLRKRVLAVVLACLDDAAAAQAFREGAPWVVRHHLLMAFTLRSADTRPLMSGPPPATLDDLYRDLEAHDRWRRLEELRWALGHLGVRMEAPDDERWTAEIVSRYIETKERQLL